MYTWNSVKYIIKGTSHNLDGTSCQDYVEIKNKDNMIIAVLSDGLGSAQYSEIASEAVVSIVLDYLAEHYELFGNNESFKKDFIDKCRNAIKEKAAEKELCAPKDMDCTLLFVAIRDNEIVLGQLGDGAVCILEKDVGRLLCIPQKGNIANTTMTVFSDNAVDSLVIDRIKDISKIKAIILTSDGLESDIYYSNSKSVRKNAGVYANAVANESQERATEIFGDRINILQNNGSDDDISIAVLSLAKSGIALPEDPTWLCICKYRNPIDIPYCAQCQEDFMDVYTDIDFSKTDKVSYFKKFNNTEEELLYITNKMAPQVLHNDLITYKDKEANEYEKISYQDQQLNTKQTPKKTVKRQGSTSQSTENSSKDGGDKPMSKEENASVKPKKIGKVIKVVFKYTILFLMCLVLSVVGSFIGISTYYQQFEKFKYGKLVQSTFDLYQSHISDDRIQDAAESDVAQKVDDIYLLLEQLHKNIVSTRTPLLYVNLDPEVYKKLIKDIVDESGENGLLINGNSGYIVYDDDSCYVGGITQDVANGSGMLFLSNGEIMMGNFKYGKKEGLFLVIEVDGDVKQVDYSVNYFER